MLPQCRRTAISFNMCSAGANFASGGTADTKDTSAKMIHLEVLLATPYRLTTICSFVVWAWRLFQYDSHRWKDSLLIKDGTLF